MGTCRPGCRGDRRHCRKMSAPDPTPSTSQTGRTVGYSRPYAGFVAIRPPVRAGWKSSRQQQDRVRSPGPRERPLTSLSNYDESPGGGRLQLPLVVSVVLPRQPSTEFLLPAFARKALYPDKASSNVRVALQLFRHVSMKDAL